MRQIAVMMSGGVDSSVTASLLRDRGWNVTGVTMKLPVLAGDPYRPCCGIDAAAVARHLGVPHHFFDIERDFAELIIEPFRRAYEKGRTPSPCVDCNTHFKFGLVWRMIRERLRIEYLATGHYVRISHDAGTHGMRRAADLSRDQSYFLYGIPRERLPYLECPLGEYTKDTVRRMADEAGLSTSRKPDSMELCFAGERDYRAALSDLPERPGPIRDTGGKVIGEHRGIQFYTLGQRRGLPASTTGALYVLKIDAATNTIVAGARDEGFTARVRAGQANVLYPELFESGRGAFGKIRSTGEPARCTITNTLADGFEVEFDEPVFAPAPGQHMVIYDASGFVIAGGTIL
jgi:tRNA-specific 2-thiouridylase